MPLRVDTKEFVASHGRAPKGFGLWFYLIQDKQGREIDVLSLTGTFTTTKAEVLQRARKAKAASVKVLP